jgi:hypothetical protein
MYGKASLITAIDTLSNPGALFDEKVPTVARHIFQACQVWIYTQSIITSILSGIHDNILVWDRTRSKSVECWWPLIKRNVSPLDEKNKLLRQPQYPG